MEFILRTAKTGFWFLIPLFFFTGAQNAVVDNTEIDVNDGEYHFKVSGNNEFSTIGNVVLHEFEGNGSISSQFGNIELEFYQADGAIPYKLGLVLTKKLNQQEAFNGVLQVNEKSFGYTLKSEGVFGFCDHRALGELPFYTQSGNVRIIEDNTAHMTGLVNLTLVNFVGDQIEISGSFSAKKTFVDGKNY